MNNLPNWRQQKHRVMMQQFQQQCGAINNRGKAAELVELCKQPALQNSQNISDEQARLWFENNFNSYRIQQAEGGFDGLITGYFEPMLKGSKTRSTQFAYPLYATPSDMVTVELASIYPQLKGLRLRGRIVGDKLVPYFTRADIEQGKASSLKPLVWINDELDAFLLQVQGSGRVQLNDGSTIRLAYANQNGHPYVSIGKTLVNWGELTAEQATIPGIRKWAERNPKRQQELLNQNPSVVFFTSSELKKPEEGPLGSLGVPLHPEQSIAIDPTVIPLGSPVFLSTTRADNGEPFQRLVLAQDTGGAIRGRVRADIFWGWGAKASDLAGITRQKGQLWLLWPKGSKPSTEQP
jgi:membrane-bound lytic murein transglycosylase A